MKSKFNIWLGDNWPGPYLVQKESGLGSISIVVHGATTIPEALERATAAFPEIEDMKGATTISPCWEVQEDGVTVPPYAPKTELESST